MTFGVGLGHVSAEEVVYDERGTRFVLVTPRGRHQVMLPLPGRHNLRNALAATAAAWAVGARPVDLAERLHQVVLPMGRWTRLRSPRGAEIVLDYAHTPVALEGMLEALRPQARRLFAVFGANGNADRGKRPRMGEVVGRWADWAMITSDNPKTEDPAEIARHVAGGVVAVGGRYEVELDRARAVQRALALAGPGDIVLVAGKGHERFQQTAEGPVAYADLDVLLAEGATFLERLD